ncbi:MAG TPA: FtsX-like permease family protein [Alphaproteobacteria bacterium]|nr:FtsX-like permease family protein [Alphaproteobacteria bacterium]
MNTLTLTTAYLRHNAARTLYNVVLFAIGTALIALVLALGGQFERNLGRNLQGIDMVVGAKGSPLQLVLSAVLHADVPTGNIPLAQAEALKKNPLIGATVPVALGDNVGGYRIVGTTPDYAAWYGATLQSGHMFARPMEAVVGSAVAAQLHLAVGQKFAGSHGLVPGGEVHSFAPYTAVGVLNPSGTILDRLVLTPVESVWYVHENDDDEPAAIRPKPADRAVTAVLVKYATPLAVASLPRQINSQTNLQAASPALEAVRLRQVLGMGGDTLTLLGTVLMVLAALGLFISMAEAMRQRLYDLALMRCFGATPLKILRLVLLEGLVISLAGGVLGLGLSHFGAAYAGAQVLGGQLSQGQTTDLPTAAALLAGVVALGLLGSFIPALKVYRLGIPQLLSGK